MGDPVRTAQTGQRRAAVVILVLAALVVAALLLFRPGDSGTPEAEVATLRGGSSDTPAPNTERSQPPLLLGEADDGGEAGRELAGTPLVGLDSEQADYIPDRIRRDFESILEAEVPAEVLDSMKRILEEPTPQVRHEYEMAGRRPLPSDIKAAFENPYPPISEEVMRSALVQSDSSDASEGSGEAP